MEEIFGGEGVSIKNPYGKTYRSGIPGQGMQDNPRHYAFNEGVKAAVQYLEGKCDCTYFVGDKYVQYEHRYLCPDCMKQIHEELGQ